jgi:hypothetical protein
MKANQEFYYEPDKPAEYLVGEFYIDEEFAIADVASDYQCGCMFLIYKPTLVQP